MIARLYAIGIPATLNLALPSLLISALNAILASFSQIYVLVLGIYYKLQTFLYLPANGFVQGMRPVIGFNYGAGEHRRVKQIYRIVLCMSGLIMIFGTIICLAVPEKLMELFTQNEETIRAGETALRIISAGFIISAVSVTSSGALEGLGKGVPSLVISLFRYVLVIIRGCGRMAWILDRRADHGSSGICGISESHLIGDGGFWKIPRPQLGYPQIIPQSYPRSGDNFDVAGLPVVEYNLRCSIYFYMKKF